jgi:hypothetical protein
MVSDIANVVLVHGAWADGSSWNKVITGAARVVVDIILEALQDAPKDAK